MPHLQHYHLEDFEGMEQLFRRNLINSLSGFKSVNLIGTVNPEQVTNLAIFSQVFHIGASPALMGVLVRPDVVARHTLANIEATEVFTINHIPVAYYQQAHQTSARYEGSEFEATGLTPWYSERLKAPYVAESQIRIGLRLAERINLAINGTVLVIGAVEEIFVPSDCLSADGLIHPDKAQSITCAGLDAYYTAQPLERLSYAKPGKPPVAIPFQPLFPE
ncbi:flavin reductase family protein [Eisenibacter elegans]|jgi:flavin reductase (DIM6/NTAB) family NADH-FMN oxidoreductase RutF|uniref:flavin reductase family protein n=1 Tax=Eisenibacter elegans TaxID=997 RepID=UPI00041C1C4E|nr:flavin reductase [Eisenibacter elegans]